MANFPLVLMEVLGYQSAAGEMRRQQHFDRQFSFIFFHSLSPSHTLCVQCPVLCSGVFAPSSSSSFFFLIFYLFILYYFPLFSFVFSRSLSRLAEAEQEISLASLSLIQMTTPHRAICLPYILLAASVRIFFCFSSIFLFFFSFYFFFVLLTLCNMNLEIGTLVLPT